MSAGWLAVRWLCLGSPPCLWPVGWSGGGWPACNGLGQVTALLLRVSHPHSMARLLQRSAGQVSGTTKASTEPRVLSQNLAQHHFGCILLAQSKSQGQPRFEVWEERPPWMGALPGHLVKVMGPTGAETTSESDHRLFSHYPFPPSLSSLPSPPDTPIQVHDSAHKTL